MAEIIFISITLFILVGLTFYLKVPKASIPLFIIYLIFIIKNQSFNQPNDLNADYQDVTISKNEGMIGNEYSIYLPPKKKEVEKPIKPKPLTFNSEPKSIEKKQGFKEPIEPKKAVKKKTDIEKNISLIVQILKYVNQFTREIQ